MMWFNFHSSQPGMVSVQVCIREFGQRSFCGLLNNLSFITSPNKFLVYGKEPTVSNLYWRLFALRINLQSMCIGLPAGRRCENDGKVYSTWYGVCSHLLCGCTGDEYGRRKCGASLRHMRRHLPVVQWRVCKTSNGSLPKVCGGMSPLCRRVQEYGWRNGVDFFLNAVAVRGHCVIISAVAFQQKYSSPNLSAVILFVHKTLTRRISCPISCKFHYPSLLFYSRWKF